MTKLDVLTSINFYRNNSFDFWTSYVPSEFSAAEKDRIILAIERLYDNSATARLMLEGLAGRDSINIGKSAGEGGLFVEEGLEFDGVNGFQAYDNYILIDPAVVLHSLNLQGERYTASLEVVLAHEVSHWFNDVSDTYRPESEDYNAVMNADPNYDYSGPNLAFENAVTLELISSGFLVGDPLPLRGSYQAMFSDNSSRAYFLQPGVSYTGGQTVDVVRYGDVSAEGVDHIDVSQQDGRFLIFGFTRDDYIRSGSINDFIYGGTGDDRLFCESAVDRLYGEDGDDYLSAISDRFAYLDGGAGNDSYRVGVDSGAWIKVGEGVDTIYLETGGMNTRQSSSIIIENGSFDDAIIWNGYQIDGGELTLFDYEIDEVDDATYETYVLSVMDHLGTQYSLGDDGETLNIRLPDQSTILIVGFENGECGLYFDNLDDLVDTILRPWSSQTPWTSFCEDGIEQVQADAANMVETMLAVHSTGSLVTPSELFL